MSRYLKRRVVVLVLTFCTIFLISCGNNNGEEEPLIQGVKLERGAVVQYKSGEYSNLNLLEGKYSKVAQDGVIINYNNESDRYVYTKENKHYVYFDGKIDEIKDERYEYIDLSPNGKYLSYFTEDEGLHLKIKEIDKNKEMEFKSDVAISGDLVDWLDENRIIYYGVDSKNNNGIFIYDFLAEEEKLIYKLEEGFVQFLKSTYTGVVFLEEHNDKGRVLKKINSATGEVETISTKIEKLTDIVEVGNSYYALGKIKNDSFSLYKIENSTITRLVYDFPEGVKEDRKMSVDKDGNILFIGANKEVGKEEVYMYTMDGSVRLISSSENEFIFVK